MSELVRLKPSPRCGHHPCGRSLDSASGDCIYHEVAAGGLHLYGPSEDDLFDVGESQGLTETRVTIGNARTAGPFWIERSGGAV